MDKIYKLFLVAVCTVGILFGLQYFLPITAQYFNIKGIAGIPGLPSMPTFAYQATIQPLPLVTLQDPASTQPGLFFIATEPPIPGVTATGTNTLTPAPGTTSIPATATRPSLPAQPTFTSIPIPTVEQPCNNVLYPLKTGQGWLYQVNTEGRTLQVNMVVSAVSGQQAKVDVSNQAAGLFKQTLVNCDNGAIRNFPPMLGELLLNNSSLGKLNIVYASGILAPSQATFENSNWNLSWKAEYSLLGNAVIPYQGRNFTLLMNNSPLTMSCQTTAAGAAAFQPISVLAGTYLKALKVLCVIESKMTGTLDGQTVSGTITVYSTQWFAPNVGLLKMQVDSSDFKLFDSLSVPLNLDGQVELIHVQSVP